MKARLLYIALFLVVCAACKKDGDDKRVAVKKKLDAIWGLCCTGVDRNRDEVLQEDERTPKSIDEDIRITIKSDGSASWFVRYLSNSFNMKATWELGSATDLAIYVSGYDSFYYTIYRIDDHEMVLIDEEANTTPTQCTIFKRE